MSGNTTNNRDGLGGRSNAETDGWQVLHGTSTPVPRFTSPKRFEPGAPICANCWAWQPPSHPFTGPQRPLATSSAQEQEVYKSQIAFLRDAGFCTLYPPSLPGRVAWLPGTQPITHATWRCSQHLHRRLAEARAAVMAQGLEPDGES